MVAADPSGTLPSSFDTNLPDGLWRVKAGIAYRVQPVEFGDFEAAEVIREAQARKKKKTAAKRRRRDQGAEQTLDANKPPVVG